MKRLLCWLGFHDWSPWIPPSAKIREVALHDRERWCRWCDTTEFR